MFLYISYIIFFIPFTYFHIVSILYSFRLYFFQVSLRIQTQFSADFFKYSDSISEAFLKILHLQVFLSFECISTPN